MRTFGHGCGYPSTSADSAMAPRGGGPEEASHGAVGDGGAGETGPPDRRVVR